MSIRIPELSEEQVEYLHEIGAMLDRELHDDPNMLKERIAEVLSHRARLTVMLGKCHRWHSEKESEFLPTVSGTVDEKKIQLRNLLKDYKFYIDTIEGQIDTIDKIISSGQSILSYEKAHLTALGMTND